MARTKSPREIRAMAYAIADEVETLAEAIWQRQPRLSYAQCQAIALRRMAGE